MEKQIKQELYASPEVEVIETQVQSVICQSGTSETSQEGDTGGWYK